MDISQAIENILKADMESLPPWEVCPESLNIVKELSEKIIARKGK